MIPNITTANMKAILKAAMPRGESLSDGIYGTVEAGRLAMKLPRDRAPGFIGMTNEGTLLFVRFTEEHPPEVWVWRLKWLEKSAITNLFDTYVFLLTFHVNGREEQLNLTAPRRVDDFDFLGQEEHLENIIAAMRRQTNTY